MKILPEDSAERKKIPVYSGFIKYFPRAIAEVAKLSAQGNIQHGLGDGTAPVWDRSKSPDELDAMMRHILDEEWVQVCWRSLANLEKQLEKKVTQEAHDNIDNVTVHGIGSGRWVPTEPSVEVAWSILSRNKNFLDFLQEQGCVDKWVSNFDPDYHEAHHDDGLVAGVFDWSLSEEGCDFWEEMEEKWSRQCK